MSGAPPSSLHPASLPVGTLVGRWRVVDWAGRGTHGAVYRAVPADKEYAAPVALKMALLPRQQPFSAPRASQMLAHLARALQSIHTQGCMHRDVKGDNVLVRHSDGRAMLIDFGTGLYPEAETLTPPDAYPGTPAYRSPESALFELHSLRSRSERYRAGPADELYALGVTACRWLTGEYPQFSEPTRDEHGVWRMEAVKLPQALEQVEPALRMQVQRLLTVRPEERGTVAQLAEELERAARPSPGVAVRAVEPPLPAPSPEVKPSFSEERSGERLPAASAHPRRTARRVWPWLASAASLLAMAVWAGWGGLEQLAESSSFLASTPGAHKADAGTTGLGEALSSASTVDAPEPSLPAMAEEPLPEPMPGQTRPDAKGRCRHKRQVALNGACWVPFDPEACEALANGQMFKDRCYVPDLPRKRSSTSQPPLKP
jgi:eukaryotic-like serine/threonine-protein kinase